MPITYTQFADTHRPIPCYEATDRHTWLHGPVFVTATELKHLHKQRTARQRCSDRAAAKDRKRDMAPTYAPGAARPLTILGPQRYAWLPY